MAQKNERVTLKKDGRRVSLSLPQDIVEYKAAGWREDSAPAPSTSTGNTGGQREDSAPAPSTSTGNTGGQRGGEK